jgi:alkanesulfonate monooxygenase SsuD/methylene tetrahydromethanopterin reductase-like flavin-dependent oxidoreductase (luciferase family)
MRVFHFTEQPYGPVWKDHEGSLRITIPNKRLDPVVAGDLFHRYYDEWQLADELGYDIMCNEHHSTATCMASTVVVTLSVLARITKKARLLVLGYPLAHRPDPLRAAEELSTIDVVSRGRLNMGFVKGVPSEFSPSNANPVAVEERFWESLDFILKAMTTHDGPFNWESENFHYRQVNIWPRPVQQPHPPVWSTTGSKHNAQALGKRGYVMATLGTGYATKPLYDAYREAYRATGRGEPPPDRFAYLGLTAVGKTEAEARARGEMVASYLRSLPFTPAPFRNPPGFISVDDNVRLMKAAGRPPNRSFTKDGRAINMMTGSVQDLIDAGILFCGTPDQVYQQITDFSVSCGGMGNLLSMGHAGFMSHEDTVENLTLFAKEVLPRLKEYRQPNETAAAAAE